MLRVLVPDPKVLDRIGIALLVALIGPGVAYATNSLVAGAAAAVVSGAAAFATYQVRNASNQRAIEAGRPHAICRRL